MITPGWSNGVVGEKRSGGRTDRTIKVRSFDRSIAPLSEPPRTRQPGGTSPGSACRTALFLTGDRAGTLVAWSMRTRGCLWDRRATEVSARAIIVERLGGETG